MSQKVATCMLNRGFLLVGVFTLALLGGCGRHLETCKVSDKDYAHAADLPPLKAPPGLQAPDTHNALKIPTLDTPERQRSKDEACLDAPPPFANAKGPAAQKPK